MAKGALIGTMELSIETIRTLSVSRRALYFDALGGRPEEDVFIGAIEVSTGGH